MGCLGKSGRGNNGGGKAHHMGEDKFIQGAIKRPGALHRKLGVPQGQKIPAAKINAAAKKPGLLGQEARFAKVLKGLGK